MDHEVPQGNRSGLQYAPRGTTVEPQWPASPQVTTKDRNGQQWTTMDRKGPEGPRWNCNGLQGTKCPGTTMDRKETQVIAIRKKAFLSRLAVKQFINVNG